MIPARLNVVIIGVRDLQAMREFYGALGWRGRPRDGLFARFELDGASLVLFPLVTLANAAGMAAEGMTPVEEGVHGRVVPAMILEDPDSLDAALLVVRRAGATIVTEPTDRQWGSRTAYFSDPEGNLWELACLPSDSTKGDS